MDRTILHCDCNGFYASVECILNPALKQVPMAVGGNEENRHGIILAKNELAKQYKIQTAETIWQARKKCPELIIVPPHHDIYKQYSILVNDIYKRYTDLVEPFGIDESWLDVTESRRLFGDGKTIADRIRAEVRKELGLTISVGVSFNKIFAKLGSDYKKPDATTVIHKNNYTDIIYPLPVTDLLFVGKATNQQLKKMNIHTIGDLAAADRQMLTKCLGKMGSMLHEYAKGADCEPVKSIYHGQEIKSVGNGMTFSRNLTNLSEIRHGVGVLSDSVAFRLRKYSLKCTTLQVTIKDTNLKVISRQQPLETPTHLSREIRETALSIILSSWNLKQPIRMITLTGTGLISDKELYTQISLFDETREEKRQKQEKLETTLDYLKHKFGKNIVSTGSSMATDVIVKKENH